MNLITKLMDAYRERKGQKGEDALRKLADCKIGAYYRNNFEDMCSALKNFRRAKSQEGIERLFNFVANEPNAERNYCPHNQRAYSEGLIQYLFSYLMDTNDKKNALKLVEKVQEMESLSHEEIFRLYNQIGDRDKVRGFVFPTGISDKKELRKLGFYFAKLEDLQSLFELAETPEEYAKIADLTPANIVGYNMVGYKSDVSTEWVKLRLDCLSKAEQFEKIQEMANRAIRKEIPDTKFVHDCLEMMPEQEEAYLKMGQKVFARWTDKFYGFDAWKHNPLGPKVDFLIDCFKHSGYKGDGELKKLGDFLVEQSLVESWGSWRTDANHNVSICQKAMECYRDLPYLDENLGGILKKLDKSRYLPIEFLELRAQIHEELAVENRTKFEKQSEQQRKREAEEKADRLLLRGRVKEAKKVLNAAGIPLEKGDISEITPNEVYIRRKPQDTFLSYKGISPIIDKMR